MPQNLRIITPWVYRCASCSFISFLACVFPLSFLFVICTFCLSSLFCNIKMNLHCIRDWWFRRRGTLCGGWWWCRCTAVVVTVEEADEEPVQSMFCDELWADSEMGWKPLAGDKGGGDRDGLVMGDKWRYVMYASLLRKKEEINATKCKKKTGKMIKYANVVS